MKDKKYYVYILTNQKNTVFYIGVTNNLERRFFEHKNMGNKNSFTYRYNINKLVYFEDFNSAENAIAAEKKIKGWKRCRKTDLIRSRNFDFKDLFL